MLYVAVQPSDMYSTCKYSNYRLNVLLKLFLLNKKKLKLYWCRFYECILEARLSLQGI